MEIRLPIKEGKKYFEKYDTGLLSERTKIETVFLWLPILIPFPMRLIWLELVRNYYRKDAHGKWVKTAVHKIENVRLFP